MYVPLIGSYTDVFELLFYPKALPPVLGVSLNLALFQLLLKESDITPPLHL